MKVKIYGIQYAVPWSFKDPKSGEISKGTSSLLGLKPNDDVEIYFNRFGSVDAVVKV